jgi:hypothetical protein
LIVRYGVIELVEHEILISFPELENAELRIHFRNAARPNEIVPMVRGSDGIFRLEGEEEVVMRLLPKYLPWQSNVRHPFAIIGTMGGVNILTGDDQNTILRRSPQNYISTPPQGAIDGGVLDGRVRAFFAGGQKAASSINLELKIFPMKADTISHFRTRAQLTDGPGHKSCGLFELNHGGERDCEPLYEDMCSLGDWDQSRVEVVRIGMKEGERRQ